jgi:hypothetical protein
MPSSAIIAAGISATAAFLAPLMEILPLSRFPPSIKNFSNSFTHPQQYPQNTSNSYCYASNYNIIRSGF